MVIKCFFFIYRNSNGNLNGYNFFCKEIVGIDGRFYMWIVMWIIMVSSEWLINYINYVCFSVIDIIMYRCFSRYYVIFNLNIFVERCVIDLKFFILLVNYIIVNVVNI